MPYQISVNRMHHSTENMLILTISLEHSDNVESFSSLFLTRSDIFITMLYKFITSMLTITKLLFMMNLGEFLTKCEVFKM